VDLVHYPASEWARQVWGRRSTRKDTEATSSKSEFNRSDVLLDWSDVGFGRGFALYLFIVVGFQLNYMYLYFLVGNRKQAQ
jgi:hypothetical protein